MKFELNIVGHAPKQKGKIKELVEAFCKGLPSQVSIGTVSFKEIVEGKTNGKQVQSKRE